MITGLELQGRAALAFVDTLREAMGEITGVTPGYAETEEALERAARAAERTMPAPERRPA